MKEKLFQKLISRKFWLCVCAFITALLTAFHMADRAAQITSLVMAFGSVVGYLFAEGLVDASAAGWNTAGGAASDGSDTAAAPAADETAAKAP